MATNTTKTKVLFGDELHNIPLQIQEQNAPCVISGAGRDEQPYNVPLSKNILSLDDECKLLGQALAHLGASVL